MKQTTSIAHPLWQRADSLYCTRHVGGVSARQQVVVSHHLTGVVLKRRNGWNDINWDAFVGAALKQWRRFVSAYITMELAFNATIKGIERSIRSEPLNKPNMVLIWPCSSLHLKWMTTLQQQLRVSVKYSRNHHASEGDMRFLGDLLQVINRILTSGKLDACSATFAFESGNRSFDKWHGNQIGISNNGNRWAWRIL